MLVACVAWVAADLTKPRPRTREASDRRRGYRIALTAAVSTLISPLAFQGSRAAVGANAVSSSAVPLGDLERAAREQCPDARRGLTFYRSAAHRWRLKMGAATTGDEAVTSRAGEGTSARPLACPQIHRAVKFWRAKAAANRLRYEALGLPVRLALVDAG